MNSLLRIYAVITKELRQLRRDRMTFGMVMMITFIQLMLFGYAINTNIRYIPAGLVDQIELMLGKIVAYMFIGGVQVTIILGLGHLIFKAPINGSLIQLDAAWCCAMSSSSICPMTFPFSLLQRHDVCRGGNLPPLQWIGNANKNSSIIY